MAAPPPKRRRFWRYALWTLALLVGVPALLAAVVIPLVFLLRSHHSEPQAAAGPPALLLERSSARDAARFPGLQTFRWRYSIPTNHVAVFSFTVWSNGVPSLMDSLSCWQAAGSQRSAKGAVQWSVQDGVMLSPELQNQERWDFKREATDTRGTSTDSGTVWTRGVLGSGTMRAARDNAVRLREGESAELLGYGETNLSVHVRFEPMPPGVSTGPQGLGGKGTNWAETFGQLPEAKQ